MEPKDGLELNAEEMAKAQQIISNALPGTYVLKELYGHDWEWIESPTNFGTRFKYTVGKKRLSGIELHPSKTGANAIQYVIGGG